MIIDTSLTTARSQWLALFLDAQSRAGYTFSEEIQHYITMTLDHYTAELHLPSQTIALSYLDALNQSGTIKNQHLRQVGDECLILVSLFPGFVKKRNISPEYIITIGRNAYETVAYSHVHKPINLPLFHVLSHYFTEIKDTLAVMRSGKY